MSVWFDDLRVEQAETPIENLRIAKNIACDSNSSSNRSSGGGGGEEVEKKGFAKVTREFVALRDGQLNVKKNCLVEVVSIVNKDWMIVRSNGEKGLVPQNCLLYPANEKETK